MFFNRVFTMMILLMLKSSCLGRPWHPPWLFRQGETPADPSGFRDPSGREDTAAPTRA